MKLSDDGGEFIRASVLLHDSLACSRLSQIVEKTKRTACEKRVGAWVEARRESL